MPALFGHARDDSFVSKAHSEKLFAAYVGDKVGAEGRFVWVCVWGEGGVCVGGGALGPVAQPDHPPAAIPLIPHPHVRHLPLGRTSSPLRATTTPSAPTFSTIRPWSSCWARYGWVGWLVGGFVWAGGVCGASWGIFLLGALRVGERVG